MIVRSGSGRYNGGQRRIKNESGGLKMKLTAKQQEQVEELLSQMTLQEKIGQMNLESTSIVGGFDMSFEQLIEMMIDGTVSQEEFQRIMATAERDYHEDDIRAGLVGAMMSDDPVKINELQKIAVEESRLGIPLLIGFDVIHGLRSVYPIAIAEAGAFDEELFEKTAHMAAAEARAHGINWTFAPMIDVARDARWGRVSEGPGEDSYLASCFAKAKIRGLQNDRTDTANYVASCLKHYVAYGACESGRDYNTTSMPLSQLHNVYLPPFRAAVTEGAATVMAAFNDLNGVPCTVNPYTLRKVLKELYDFSGFVVSDANAVRECVAHGIAANEEDAGVQAVRAGLDMDMGTGIYKTKLGSEVLSGGISMDMIDDAVRRILSVKVWLGLFEKPYVPKESIDRYRGVQLPSDHVQTALDAAKRSIVLLKNDRQILPLKKGQKISLVGALADQAQEVCGARAMSWKKDNCVSVLDGLRRTGADVVYHPCCAPDGEINEAEVDAACRAGDVIVAVVGEWVSMSGEASSRADIGLPGRQKELLARLAGCGKPLVVLLMNGRPLAIGEEAAYLSTIVECWHLGIEMGNAVAAVLFGDENPSAKLSASFPFVTGQCPVYYDHPSTGRPGGKSKFTSKYLDAPFDALFPFGYGLSYTTFAYSDLCAVEEGDQIRISCALENTGARRGTEIVQLYMQDVTASLVRPVRELKGFRRVTLEAGEKVSVIFTLNKADMGFYDNDGTYVFEPGLFKLYVGGNSRDCLCADVDVKEV